MFGALSIQAVAVAVLSEDILGHKILLSRIMSDTRNLPPSNFSETSNFATITFLAPNKFKLSLRKCSEASFLCLRSFMTTKVCVRVCPQ